jgi:hypothetical protein
MCQKPLVAAPRGKKPKAVPDSSDDDEEEGEEEEEEDEEDSSEDDEDQAEGPPPPPTKKVLASALRKAAKPNKKAQVCGYFGGLSWVDLVWVGQRLPSVWVLGPVRGSCFRNGLCFGSTFGFLSR